MAQDVEFLFQFPPLREGRLERSSAVQWCILFQFPPLREGRHTGQALTRFFQRISIPTPARGATFAHLHMYIAIRFQFPPLREGRQQI